MSLSYRKVKGKIVLCVNGVYVALTKDQINALELVIDDIKTGKRKYYKDDNRQVL